MSSVTIRGAAFVMGKIMADLGFAEAFAKYKAKLHNVQWSVCADAPDGSLVVSLWEHHFEKSGPGKICCRGSFARWSGPGNSEFRSKVAHAFAFAQNVKVVIAHATDIGAIESGMDASTVKKSFSVRADWCGRVKSIDGEEYVFEFERI